MANLLWGQCARQCSKQSANINPPSPHHYSSTEGRKTLPQAAQTGRKKDPVWGLLTQAGDFCHLALTMANWSDITHTQQNPSYTGCTLPQPATRASPESTQAVR